MNNKELEVKVDAGEAAIDVIATLFGLGPLAGAGKLGRLIIGWSIAKSAKDRTKRFYIELAATMKHGTSTEVEAYLFENIDQPWLRGNLNESFRNLINALDEAVIPAIAKLTAKYLDEHRAPDPFARNVGRMLVEMNHDDLVAMAAVLEAVTDEPLAVEEHIVEHAPMDICVTGSPTESSRFVLIYLREDHKEGDRLVVDDPKGYTRILELLKQHSLAWSEPRTSFGAITEIGQMKMRADVAEKLHEIV